MELSAEIWKARRGGQALSVPGVSARPAQLKTKNKLPFWTVISSVFNELFSDEMFTSRKYTSTSCSVAFEWTTLWKRPTKRKKLGSNMSYSGFMKFINVSFVFRRLEMESISRFWTIWNVFWAGDFKVLVPFCLQFKTELKRTIIREDTAIQSFFIFKQISAPYCLVEC